MKTTVDARHGGVIRAVRGVRGDSSGAAMVQQLDIHLPSEALALVRFVDRGFANTSEFFAINLMGACRDASHSLALEPKHNVLGVIWMIHGDRVGAIALRPGLNNVVETFEPTARSIFVLASLLVAQMITPQREFADQIAGFWLALPFKGVKGLCQREHRRILHLCRAHDTTIAPKDRNFHISNLL